jgi:hypothetical protein
MYRHWIKTLIISLCAIPLGCDEPSHEPEPIKASGVAMAAAPRDEGVDVDSHLLSNVTGRRSWSMRDAKVDADKPDLRVELDNPSGQRRIVDAWPATAQRKSAVVRIDWSERLYEITPAEWDALRQRAGR